MDDDDNIVQCSYTACTTLTSGREYIVVLLARLWLRRRVNKNIQQQYLYLLSANTTLISSLSQSRGAATPATNNLNSKVEKTCARLTARVYTLPTSIRWFQKGDQKGRSPKEHKLTGLKECVCHILT